MAADIPASMANWNVAEASNLPVGPTSVVNLDDNQRMIQSVLRYVFSMDTLASATTTDLGSKESGQLAITGTTTITSFGTISAGILRWVYFSGALTLTHNGTSLILPTAANIATAAGDCALMQSLGGGNWRCLAYMRASGQNIAGTTTFGDGAAATPSIAFQADLDTGFYRIGANNMGLSLGGTKRMDFSPTRVQFNFGGLTSIGDAVSILSAPGSDASVRTGDPVTNIAAGKVTIAGGSVANGGGGALRGDVEILGGNQTYTGGSTGTRGGDVLIAGGLSSDPSSSAISGTIRNRIGLAASGATPGSWRVQDGTGTVDLLAVDGNRKTVAVGGTTPTISSGAGTGASIAGKTNAFKVTFGTTAGTTVVINLPVPVTGAGAFANAPVVAVNYEGTIVVYATATTTQVTLTFASAPANGTVCHVILLGYE